MYTLQFSRCLSSSSWMWVKSIVTVSCGRTRAVDIKLIYINATSAICDAIPSNIHFQSQQMCTNTGPHPLHKIAPDVKKNKEEADRSVEQSLWWASVMLNVQRFKSFLL